MTSFNAYMHPRNIYKKPLNFEELCHQHPELLTYTKRKPSGKMIFNFKDRDGLRCLCTVLLKKDFDLQITIPDNRLVPTLPLRLNYILWIEDLLQSHLNEKSADCINGIDIGTGATCIYPLLIAKKYGWKMTGVDIVDDIIDAARKNVLINKLTHLISIMKISSSVSELLSENIRYDFCMCNPPFFDSTHDESALLRKRNRVLRLQSHPQKSGTLNEVSSPGGEIAFIKNLIEESVKLGARVRIYSTMIGCKSSVQPVLNTLKEKKVSSYCETKFCQGRTMRWAVAWTFTDTCLKTSTKSIPVKKPMKSLTWTLKPKYNFKKCVTKMDRMLEELGVNSQVIKRSKKIATWKMVAGRNTWTGLRRKRREQLTKAKIDVRESHELGQSNAERSHGSVLSLAEINVHCEGDDDCDVHVPCKKVRMNEECDSPVLEAEIEMKWLHQNVDNDISIRITFIRGQREAPQQILQFFKNNLV